MRYIPGDSINGKCCKVKVISKIAILFKFWNLEINCKAALC